MKQDLTIDILKKKKQHLEYEIENFLMEKLKEFKQSTGVIIDSVYIDFIDISSYSKESLQISEVTINIKI